MSYCDKSLSRWLIYNCEYMLQDTRYYRSSGKYSDNKEIPRVILIRSASASDEEMKSIRNIIGLLYPHGVLPKYHGRWYKE